MLIEIKIVVAKAKKYFIDAKNLGSKSAEFNLGWMALKGLGEEVNLDIASKYFTDYNSKNNIVLKNQDDLEDSLKNNLVDLKKNNLRQSRYLSKKALDNNHNSLKIIELNALTSIFVGNRIEAINYYKEIIDIQENQSWRIWKSLLKCVLEIEEWSELLKLSLRAKKYFPNKSFLDFK